MTNPIVDTKESQIPDEKQIQSTIQSVLKSKLSNLNDSNLHQPNSLALFKTLNNECGESIKKNLIDLYPKGYKFIVCTQMIENKGQKGTAGLVSFWDEENDKVITGIWSNDFIIGTATVIIIKVAY
ncbi:hypothetical protein O181_040329 [Austropuccinia psidii MF-1]|uniref:Topoisomerase I damage affected protein 2 n=1 Tax=Austropuccinia psidii MF-1 TaxID=1389203 RepID=A0A9Q3DC13_9BASI|nr:hypothetical protein [Austropuccinia psidii MF-1]